ncbi:MAG TPA: hypothetical protein VGD43_01315 [Micromonospora sp.]
MLRARRLVAAATVAVGLVALTGCRSEPGVAAYVGDKKITEEAVTRIVDELRDTVPSSAEEEGHFEGDGHDHSGGQDAAVNLPQRTEVVNLLVLTDLCRRVSEDNGYRPRSQVVPEQWAERLRLPAESTYVQRKAQFDTCLSGLPVDLSARPSEEEFTEVITAAKQAGLPELSRAEAIQQLDGELLRTALATKRALAGAMESYPVTVNPRYRPLDFPVLSFQSGPAAVSVRLADGTGSPVVELGVDPR